MGKKGDALRAAKMQNTIYRFTRQQLADHDQRVREEFQERVMADVSAKVQKRMEKEFAEKEEQLRQVVNAEWDERKERFASENPVDNFFEFLSCTLAVSVRVLIEQFGWTPLPVGRKADPRMKLVRFSGAVAAEIDRIAGDEMLDIRKYAEEVFTKYGVKFAAEEE